MRYRKKPVIVEAFQYDGDFKNKDGNYYVPKWAVDAYNSGVLFFRSISLDEPPCELWIETLEGDMRCPVGNYIIRGLHGELYSCEPRIFKETYEGVDE